MVPERELSYLSLIIIIALLKNEDPGMALQRNAMQKNGIFCALKKLELES